MAPGNPAPHRHDHIEIIWITRGKGSLFLDARLFDLPANTLYAIALPVPQEAYSPPAFVKGQNDDPLGECLVHARSEVHWQL